MDELSLIIPSWSQYPIAFGLLKDFTPAVTSFTPDCFLSHLYHLFLLSRTVSQEHTNILTNVPSTLPRCHVIYYFSLLQIPFHLLAAPYQQLLKVLSLFAVSTSLRPILFFFFFDYTQSMWKLPHQGLNLHHSSNWNHSGNNARSLTCQVTRALLFFFFSF